MCCSLILQTTFSAAVMCHTAWHDHRCLKRHRCLLIHVLTLPFFFSVYPVLLHSLIALSSWLSPSFCHGFWPLCSLSIGLDPKVPWEQPCAGRSRQSYPAGTPSSGRGGMCCFLLQKRQCPLVREIQPSLSKYKEQPPSQQTMGMTFNIFDFYCFHFNLYWLLTIKLSRHFLHVFLNHLSSAVLSIVTSLLLSSPLACFLIFFFFFSIYLSLCPLGHFLKSHPQELKNSSIYLMENELKFVEGTGYSHQAPRLVVFILSSNPFSLSWLFCL